MKHALTIAGSDCSGGAGIQADIKTFCAHGVYAMSVIASVVAENTSRVISVFDVDPAIIQDQIDAVFEDIPVDAVKIGMLSNAQAMEAVAEKLEQYRPQNVVMDPVMIAKGGQALMQDSALETLIRRIIPLSTVLTPNIPEAETITGRRIETEKQMEDAARDIHKMGAKYVMLKGGHLAGDANDLLFDGASFTHYRTKRIDTKNTHGTGCTFSSAIAANLAKGESVAGAIRKAKDYITLAIAHALPIGHGHGPTHHFYQLYKDGGLNDEL